MELDALNALKASRLSRSGRNCCQCCLSSVNLKSMSSLGCENVPFVDLLASCFSILIVESEPGEDFLICGECALELERSHLFRRKVEESQIELRIALEALNTLDTLDNDAFDSIEFLYKQETIEKNETTRSDHDYMKTAPKPQPEIQEYACRCGKTFPTKVRLSRHAKRHETAASSCPVCGKTMRRPSLPRHMKIHTGAASSVYSCPRCEERFPSFGRRIRHMEKAHRVDIYTHVCEICTKKFHLMSGLSDHVRRCHFQDKNVQCEHCGKEFFNKNCLKKHILKHHT